MNQIKKAQSALFFAVLLAVSSFANATSVLDTTTLTQITGGFTDMKDTLLGLLGVAWPFLIAVPVIMMAPRIVSKLVKMIGRG